MSLQLVSETRRVARKEHACWVCGPYQIQAGQTYIASTNVYDGRIYTLKTCHLCDAVALDVYDWAYATDDGIGPGEYIEWAEEHADDDPRAATLMARIATPRATTHPDT